MSVVSPMTTPVPWSMKKLSPMWAPGWMSMPVWLWAYSVMMRGISGTSWCMKLVGEAVDGDGEEAGVAEDDFVVALGGGVALEGGPHVLGQGAPQVGQLPHEADGVFLAPFLAVGAGQVVAQAFVADGQGDLLGQDLEEGHGLLAEIVAQVDLVQPFADEIAGVEEAAGPVDDVDHRFPGRDGFRAHVVEAVLPPAGAHQLIDDVRDGLPEFLGGLGFHLAAVQFQLNPLKLTGDGDGRRGFNPVAGPLRLVTFTDLIPTIAQLSTVAQMASPTSQ